jgi:hypothetical protein
VLNENLAELRDLAQDALEDGVLMGCDEAQLREVLAASSPVSSTLIVNEAGAMRLGRSR